ncbi:KPBB-like protein [Mya arenaria]|uniref:Phosphorylase b kinase regulatory subunit n=1 Tax=Mya arenaria TaxID=6604 RepID=A0ABY7EWM3_MYAAR|nr:KPBB-like protein [Mya arenaria]
MASYSPQRPRIRRMSSVSTDPGLGMILAKGGDNRISGIEDSSPEKDLKKELDEQYRILKRQILQYQSMTLGLFPRIGCTEKQSKVASVRDSIYCAAAAWALSQAFRRIDNDGGRTHELAQIAVKCMRGILYCWLRQADKIDIVALYILFLVQMTTSGLQIIFTTDEVSFVQNLVFYVERAYRTPDYGMWERGSKYNIGVTEVHASSIGLAKAALEAVNGVNLFGDQGASWSVIFVDIDAHNRNRTIFESILPRESNSKNTDASLLATVSWPAFAIHEEPVRSRTISKVIRKLSGVKGIKRIFQNDKEGVKKYSAMLDHVMTRSNDGLLMPHYFYIPAEQVEIERMQPGRGRRYPSDAGSTKGIFLWGQAVYFISQLLVTDFYMAQDISINDLTFLSKCWKLAGRPTFCMLIRENNIRGTNFTEFLELLAAFKSGDVDGIRVRVGRLQLPDPSIFQRLEQSNHGQYSFKSLTDIPAVMNIADNTVLDEADLKVKATWDLIQMFRCTESLEAQAQLLKLLLHREGPNYTFEGQSVSRRLDQLVTRAGLHKQWGVVRLCSALLRKLVDSLAPSITSILVRGKQLTVGVFGHEEEVLDKPVSPNEIKSILYSKCMPYNICQAVLQQELILAIGKHIATMPETYDGILKIRIGWFVRAMEMEMELEEDHVPVTSLSPYQVKQLLMNIILVHRSDEYDIRSPLQQRQLDGALSRVPKDFYERVWEILERTPGGIKVAGYLLPQQPTLSDMTMQELNFSLLVEEMLSKIIDPAYRQLMVEAFMVVSTILRRNPELMFHHSVNMDKTISDAFEEFQKDRSRLEGDEKQDDMRQFFNTLPNIKHGTTSYIIKAVVKNLLDGDIKVSMEDMNKRDELLSKINKKRN